MYADPLPIPVAKDGVARPRPEVNLDNKDGIMELLDWAYERDKAKLNNPPPPSPLQMIEWFKRIIREL